MDKVNSSLHQANIIKQDDCASLEASMKHARLVDSNQDYYKPWVKSYPQGVKANVNTRPYENLSYFFDSASYRYKKRTALSNFGSALAFGEIENLVNAFALYLQYELKLQKGDKLAIMMPNILQFPVALFGALKAGLIVTNLNPLYTPREMQAQLDNADAKVLVVIENYAHNVVKIIDKTKLKHIIITKAADLIEDAFGLKRFLMHSIIHFRALVKPYDSSKFPHCILLSQALKIGKRHSVSEKIKNLWGYSVDYNDIAILQYTGGTTGKSKGAMLSHGNLIANVMQAVGMYGAVLKVDSEGHNALDLLDKQNFNCLDEINGECILTVIPLYHIFALTVNLLLFYYIGAHNILITDPRDLKSFANTVKKYPQISALTGVNTLFNVFISSKEFQEVNFPNLRLVIGGGAAVQSGVEERFFKKTNIHILEGYGLTECSPLCCVCPYDTDHYTGSIGLAVPNTIVRIVDSNGHEIQDKEHEGELEIKGPQVMHGYYKDNDKNASIFHDGYIRTGDIAKWIDGGYIKLIDRLKDMILVSGFNVFPNEIEDVVSRFNRVFECAVIGIPSEHTGEGVKLFVVKKDPLLTEDELKAYCRAYLTPYKVPRIIEFVDALPKSPLGKVLRRKLRDMELEKNLTLEEQLALKETQKTQVKPTKAKDDLPSMSHGAQTLANLLSSKHEGFEAAVDTPNIHSNHHQPTSGAQTLANLLSSKHEGFEAAVDTPNIHHHSTQKNEK